MNARQEISVEGDGLICSEVGDWAEDKYRLISLYDELFATGMKDKWDQRIYVDLYSGAGFSQVRNSSKILKGSPILALSVKYPFNKYVFCEGDPEKIRALESRVRRLAPSATCDFVSGSCDQEVDRILRSIPKPPRKSVISLCIVDPFDFGIKFETIRKLSSVKIDFLVLMAVGMDANRNYDHYVGGDNVKIDEALGNLEWRERWKYFDGGRKKFRQFLALEFASSMRSLGYLDVPLDRMKLVRSTERNLPLYYLALFSRHSTAYQFWDEVLKYGTDQTSFAWGTSDG